MSGRKTATSSHHRHQALTARQAEDGQVTEGRELTKAKGLRARRAEPTMRTPVQMHQPRARRDRAKDKEMKAGSGVSAPD